MASPTDRELDVARGYAEDVIADYGLDQQRMTEICRDWGGVTADGMAAAFAAVAEGIRREAAKPATASPAPVAYAVFDPDLPGDVPPGGSWHYGESATVYINPDLAVSETRELAAADGKSPCRVYALVEVPQ